MYNNKEDRHKSCDTDFICVHNKETLKNSLKIVKVTKKGNLLQSNKQ